jgi:hypothetical protein
MFIMKKKKLAREREKDILEEMQDRVVQDALDRTRKPKKKKAEKEDVDDSEKEESQE